MKAADRQRIYRARRRRGERVARVVVDIDVIDMLVDHNWLAWGDCENPVAIEQALSEAIRDLAKRDYA